MINTKRKFNIEKINEKIELLNDKFKKFNTIDNSYYDYLWYLMNEPIQSVFDEKNGEEYKSVVLLNNNGTAKNYGLSILIELYMSYHERKKWNQAWLGLLEKLTFIDNKLKIIGNHSATSEIKWEEVVEKFIEFHMNKDENYYYKDWTENSDN